MFQIISIFVLSFVYYLCGRMIEQGFELDGYVVGWIIGILYATTVLVLFSHS